MSIENEQERRLAMLRAVVPYATPESRRAIELLLQANTFVNLATTFPTADFAAADMEEQNYQADPEEILLHIREYCTPKEADMIQVLLNFIHAGKLFRNYRNFLSLHPELGATQTAYSQTNNPMSMIFQLINGLGSLENNFSNQESGSSNSMMEFLLSQLSPEQRATLENLQSIMYN